MQRTIPTFVYSASAFLVHHVVITVEKTYSSIGRGVVTPLETTLKAMHETSPTSCPTYRFEEWTWYDKSGLEFTLAAIIPPLSPSMVFGKAQSRALEREMTLPNMRSPGVWLE